MPPVGVLLLGFAAGGHDSGAVIILHQLPPGDGLGWTGDVGKIGIGPRLSGQHRPGLRRVFVMRRVIRTFVILPPLTAVVREDHSGLLASHATHLAGGLETQAALKVAAVIPAVQSLIT